MNAQLRPGPAVWHRPMAHADINAVLALEAQAYPYPWSRGNFIDSLAAGYTTELRLDAQDRLLGYFVALPGFEEMHLLNLTVAPLVQRAGHGQALMQRLLAIARARADAALWLEVRLSNAAARSLYQRLGFAEVSRRRFYYPAAGQQREDALVLRLGLRDGAAGAHPMAPGGPE